MIRIMYVDANAKRIRTYIFILSSAGGYFHRVNDLTYGVDLQRIRWTGILQV